MNKGKFIVFEGIDGSGSTTQSKRAFCYLVDKSKANEVLFLREPTSRSEKGREIRRRLENRLNPEEEVSHDKNYWTHLFVADRRIHVATDIIHGIEVDYQMICNRYMFSTLAYQSAQGMDLDELIEMHEGWCIAPDLTVYLEVPVEIASERRMRERGKDPEFFEDPGKGLLVKAAENYLRAIEKLEKLHNVVIVNGNRSIEEVAKDINPLIDKLY